MMAGQDMVDARRMFAELGAPSWVVGACRTFIEAVNECTRLRAMTPEQRAAEWSVLANADKDDRHLKMLSVRDAKRAKKATERVAKTLRMIDPPTVEDFGAHPEQGAIEYEDASTTSKPKRKLTVVSAGGGAVKMATDYVAKFATHPDGVTLRRWRGDSYRWLSERNYYLEVSDEQIESSLYRELGLTRRQDVGDVRHALIAVDDVLIDGADLNTWIGDAPNAAGNPHEIAACPNGLIHLPTRKLIPASPRYFATTALGVAFDPEAKAPASWLAFLSQLWGDDSESIEALQEWFGYLLTADTRQQKILLLVGAKRSGKGTIMRILSALIGYASVAAPTLSSLGTNFGLWPLIGKTAAIIGDARLGGRSDITTIVERLLSISGEDALTVDRKHRDPWTGRLSARVAIVSNELPRFTDASDAIVSRMLILELSQSFYGKEDPDLTDKLLADLPGILLWAIDGWHRLRKRGHFLQPSTSRGTIEEMADLASPVGAWVRERCAKGYGATMDCTEAYRDFERWAQANGHHVTSQNTFAKDLKATTQTKRIKVRNGLKTSNAYAGLELLL
jgi:P4 family phage/plasmid primase-like protien